MGLKLFHLFQPTNPDKPLGGRYKIISKLGEGGFGQTFLAEDLHLPDHPQCVVKQLKPQVSNPDQLQTARRLFDIEARVLYQLGHHDQIPRLLAHFEDTQEFYLAQELIEGEPLTQELGGGELWREIRVIALLQDLLHVLAFVHQQQVIHRDIKPSNLIRRKRDGKIVLIDFGAVKQVSTQVVNAKTGQTKTISIGTQGYTPKEQLGGNPRFSSDVYAVGMIGIQALTGIHPRRLKEDPQTGEIDWRNQATQVSPELAEILDCMVRYDFRVRYPTAKEALEAIQQLPTALIADVPLPQQFSETSKVLPNQEPQSQSTATESTGTGTDLSSTNIWVPTEAPVQPHPTAESTETGTDLSSTNIWVPTEAPIQPQPIANSSSTEASLHQPQRSQHSGSSAPMSTTLGLLQRQWVKSWPVLTVLVVGATFLLAKPLLSPQLSNQIADEGGVSAESPTARTAQKPTPPSPASPAAESPTPSPTEKPASPSPASPAAKNLTPSPTKKPASPSPASIAVAIQASPTPVPPAAKPKPTPTPPPAKPAPPPPEPQAAELLSQADRFREAGQYQKAVDLYNQAIARNPNVAQAYWGHCYSLNSLQQPAEAISSCNKALDLNPNYPEALWSKGNALDQQQRPMDALKLYEKATTLKPDFAEAWNNQGVALLALDRSTEAIAAFDKATTLKPSFADAWANQGAALWKLGRFDGAIASLDQALKIQPDNPTAINLRQQAREKLGR